MSYKKSNGVGTFFKVLGIILLILLVVASVTAILYATVPVVKDFIERIFNISQTTITISK